MRRVGEILLIYFLIAYAPYSLTSPEHAPMAVFLGAQGWAHPINCCRSCETLLLLLLPLLLLLLELLPAATRP